MRKLLFLLLLPNLSKGQSVFHVGAGSGSLDLVQATIGCHAGDTVYVLHGSYNYMTSDLKGTDANRIWIKNEGGEVGINNGRFDPGEGRNVVISGNGTPGVTYGFRIHDYNNRGMQFGGDSAARNLTVQWVKFENIDDNAISFDNRKDYDVGNISGTVHTNLKFLHCWFENSSRIDIDGHFNNADFSPALRDDGRIKGIEVAYCTWKNSADMGASLYFGNVDSFDIHHNVIDSVNASNDNHNGIFLVHGCNGYIRYIKYTNGQGNITRLWEHQPGTGAKKKVYVYNNLVVNTRKYGGVEVQTFDYTVIPGTSVSNDTYIYNNTLADLNTTHDWQSAILDLYSLDGGYSSGDPQAGTVTYKNNVIINNYYTTPGADGYVNYAGGSNTPDSSNNSRFLSFLKAGIVDSTVSFAPADTSILLGLGTNLSSVISDDYYGTSRPNPPSIGAVELQTPPEQLDPPTLTIGTITGTTIALSWTTTSGATNYVVQKSTASDFSGATQIYSSSGTSTTATGLSPNTHYYFRVKAQASGFTDSGWDSDDATTLDVVINRVKYFKLKIKR